MELIRISNPECGNEIKALPISNNLARHSELPQLIPKSSTFQKLLDHVAGLAISIPLHAVTAAVADAKRLPMMTGLLELGLDVNADDRIMGPCSRGPFLVHAIESGGIMKV